MKKLGFFMNMRKGVLSHNIPVKNLEDCTFLKFENPEYDLLLYENKLDINWWYERYLWWHKSNSMVTSLVFFSKRYLWW